ncbi:MAG TPA: RHS repeat-associated core domain-containing protein [Ktedonobacteraceae bacterium]|nr:RHS repeat-associated core domain-containing protein [Ktedonobacteraceae bacterium]
MTGLYPVGTTCATRGSATAVYSASYDPWGNQSSRTYNNVTATLSYDQLNRLVQWDAGSNGQEWYVYDASGNRVLKRSLNGGTTKLTIYVFGLEEYSYTGSGVLSNQLHYYAFAGHLIGAFDGTNTTFYLTDALGSVLTSLSQNTILGEQIYGPYGASRYLAGNINTTKGYTGQFYDAVSGLNYYNARYYDPVVGVFVSPDTVQTNLQGTNPYAYVKGNPETATDPSGQADNDPYLVYVASWYIITHPTDKVAIDKEYKGLGFPYADWRNWQQYLNNDTIGKGRPDIANGTKQVIWEVKTGGGNNLYDNATDSGMGSDFPASSTFTKGIAQARWYAQRMSMATGTQWNPGSKQNDPEVGIAMTLCGGACVITYSDGSEMEIMATDYGVIQYQFVPGKGPVEGQPEGKPAVVNVRGRQGQSYTAAEWERKLVVAMIIATVVEAILQSISKIRPLFPFINPALAGRGGGGDNEGGGYRGGGGGNPMLDE